MSAQKSAWFLSRMSVEDRLKAEGIEVRSEKLSPASISFLYGKDPGADP